MTVTQVRAYAKKIVNKYGHGEISIEVINDGLELYSGVYDAKTKTITVNMFNIRTFRDLTYVILHEIGHHRQAVAFKNPRVFLLNYWSDERFYERDADKFAFREEQNMEYKSFVITECSFSVFMNRKMAHRL